MESLSQITGKVRLPLSINVAPYLMDHRFQGKAVLPAVEAMGLLAASTLAHLPGKTVHYIRDARFDKFLAIEDDCDRINAFNNLEVFNNGAVVSRLITKTRSKKAMITRTREHAALRLEKVPREPTPLPLETLAALEGVGFHVPTRMLYQELVPFGPSYHNLTEGVTISENGAMASVYARPLKGAVGPLGSPFPLDAAFHAACVWGQRYAGLVGFPVGFKMRRVFAPTCSGSIYTARIIPRETYSDRFLVDIWLTGPDGAIHEEVRGVLMRDVSGGRMKPPPWVSKGR